MFEPIPRKLLYLSELAGKTSIETIFSFGLHPQNALERFVGIFSRREEKRGLTGMGEGEYFVISSY